jgi:hypothetical protein
LGEREWNEVVFSGWWVDGFYILGYGKQRETKGNCGFCLFTTTNASSLEFAATE